MKPPKSRKAELAANATGGGKSHAEAKCARAEGVGLPECEARAAKRSQEAARGRGIEFKQTELGPIPKDWEVERLGEIWSSFKTGPFGSSLHAQDYVENGTPLINPMHIQDGKIEPSPDMTVDDATKQRLSAYKLSQDDIIIGRRGEMGRAALVGKKEIGWLCGTGCFFLHLDESCCPNYIALYLRTPASVVALEGEAVGTTLVNLNRKILGDLKLPLPPLAEQRRIARALSDVDELISALGKLIEKKRNIKTGAMQQLLTGKTRLPGFGANSPRSNHSHAEAKCARAEGVGLPECEARAAKRSQEVARGREIEFKQTELGPIPVDWEVKRLGEVCEIVMGQSPASDYYNTTGIGYPLIQGNADICNRRSIIRIYTSLSLKICNEGDIIMSVRAPVGAVGRASYKSCLGRGVCALKAASDYLYHYLIFVEKRWGEFSKGSTFDSINSEELFNYELPVPPTLAEQKAIAAVLSDIDAEIAALEADRAKYERIKSGMMQELLTGKTRIGGFAAHGKAQDVTAGIGSDL